MNETERKWFERYELSPEKVLENFLPLLHEAWQAKKSYLCRKSSEDRITRTIYSVIQQELRKRNANWGCYPQVEFIEEDGEGFGKVRGRCDLIITLPANREYIFECKCLKKNKKSLMFTASANLYVNKGMMRFITPSKLQYTSGPQYSTWLGFAGMIGYVMDGTISCACNELIVAIKKHASPLSIYSLHPKECPSGEAEHFLSEHVNCLRQPVKMHHIVLGLQDTEETPE